MAIFYSPRIVTDGLVLCLDAGNTKSYSGSGTTWTDLSGNGNNCVWSTTPSFSNGAFTLNGSTHYGTITNNSTLNFSSAQTLMMVLRHSYTSGRKNPWNQAYAGYGTWTHEEGSTMSQYFGNGGGDNSPYIGISSAATPRNVWNFMCATRDTSVHKWYINGQLSSTTSNPYGTLATTSANISIGNGYAGLWIGDMSVIIAYTRALSSNEVLQNYNALRGRYGLS